MIGHRLKIILIYVISCQEILEADGRLSKRTPLEIGFVTFPAEENPTIFVSLNQTKPKIKSPDSFRNSRTHEWIPGRIRDHAYIPAHIHRIFFPLLIPVKYQAVAPFELYTRQFGGFGIGSHSGGQGAGHGFQIVFND